MMINHNGDAKPGAESRNSSYGPLQRYVTFGDFERDRWIEQEIRLVPKGARVLDAGAGPCRYRHLFEHCEYRSHDFAQLSSDVTTYGALDFVSDITSIPVPDASFDVILCTEVLEHVPNPIAAVNEFSRILKPGGLLLLTAPQRSGEHQAPYHYYGGFTRFWYEKFLTEAEFETITVIPNGGFFKHYGEAGWQLIGTIFSDDEQGQRRKRLLFPLLAAMKLYALVQCIICHYLDSLDKTQGMTVGYHVKATKAN